MLQTLRLWPRVIAIVVCVLPVSVAALGAVNASHAQDDRRELFLLRGVDQHFLSFDQ